MARRILTALVLIPLVVALVLYGSLEALAAVQTTVALAALWEFFRLAERIAGRPVRQFPGYLLALGVSLLPLWNSDTLALLPPASLCGMAVMAYAMKLDANFPLPAAPVLFPLLGVAYAVLPLSLLVEIARHDRGRPWVLFALVVIWVSDSAGFFVGKTIGRHRSSPRISPNKTWEGTIASFLAALLTGFAWSVFSTAEGEWILAIALNLSGQIGDLAESALKRRAGVKDSSHLVPGHGGVLDRIDALLFAVLVLWYYLLWQDLAIIR